MRPRWQLLVRQVDSRKGSRYRGSQVTDVSPVVPRIGVERRWPGDAKAPHRAGLSDWLWKAKRARAKAGQQDAKGMPSPLCEHFLQKQSVWGRIPAHWTAAGEEAAGVRYRWMR